MTERLPSLDLLLDLVRAERDQQFAHFDALDAKAGIVRASLACSSRLPPMSALDTES